MATRVETNSYLRRRRRAQGAAALGALVLVSWMVWLTVRHQSDAATTHAANSEKTSAQASASAVGSVANQGKALAKTVQQQCKTDLAFRADNPTLCVQASVLATTTPTPIPGPTGPAGPGPSDVQVQVAVDTYLALHPPPIDYTVLRAFVNTYLSAHPAPSGSAGAIGASGSPGQPGESGQPGVAGSSGESGASGLAGQPGDPGKDAPVVTGIVPTVAGTVLTLTFQFSGGAPDIPVTVDLPNNCPATATITTSPGPPNLGNDPTTTYTVCAPK